MLRLLVWLALALVGWLFVRSLVAAIAGGRDDARVGARRRRGEPIGPAEALVRDRECETYLPRSRAIRHVDGDGNERFFCSEACRDAFLARVREAGETG